MHCAKTRWKLKQNKIKKKPTPIWQCNEAWHLLFSGRFNSTPHNSPNARIIKAQQQKRAQREIAQAHPNTQLLFKKWKEIGEEMEPKYYLPKNKTN